MPERICRILVLGDAHATEMRPLSKALVDILSRHQLRETASAPTALQFADDGWFPDLVVVFQGWSDEFSSRDVARLLSAFPLARWICCYGSWCESDGRNRNDWPPATRIAVRAALPRIQRELDVLENQLPALPLTAGREEVYAFDCPAVPRLPSRDQSIGIVTPDSALRDWLRDLLKAAGFRPSIDGIDFDGVAAVVWDVDPLINTVHQRIQEFTALYPDTPIISLSSGASAEVSEILAELGVNSVVPKLATSEILLETLDRRLNEAACRS